MVGVVVITHGMMAEGILDSVQMIMGEQEQLTSLGLMSDMDIENFKELVYEKIKEVDQGKGVLAFVDLFGASPFNSAGANLTRLSEEETDLRVVTGVNLPMLLETMNARNYMETLDELYTNAIDTGKEGIIEMRDFLGQ